MANAPKPTTAKNENSKGSGIFAGLAILFCLAIGWLLFLFVMGSPTNFENGDPTVTHFQATISEWYIKVVTSYLS